MAQKKVVFYLSDEIFAIGTQYCSALKLQRAFEPLFASISVQNERSGQTIWPLSSGVSMKFCPARAKNNLKSLWTPPTGFSGCMMKFIRRHDLEPHTRIEIVRLAWINQGFYGKMTQIAQDYHISRTFLYQLTWAAQRQLDALFSVPACLDQDLQSQLEPLILLLRLEGKCSLPSISSILKHFAYQPSSVGYLSEYLQDYGRCVPSTLSMAQKKVVFYLSDEIFAIGTQYCSALKLQRAFEPLFASISVQNERSGQTIWPLSSGVSMKFCPARAKNNLKSLWTPPTGVRKSLFPPVKRVDNSHAKRVPNSIDRNPYFGHH